MSIPVTVWMPALMVLAILLLVSALGITAAARAAGSDWVRTKETELRLIFR